LPYVAPTAGSSMCGPQEASGNIEGVFTHPLMRYLPGASAYSRQSSRKRLGPDRSLDEIKALASLITRSSQSARALVCAREAARQPD
jgi:hypothetical protein